MAQVQPDGLIEIAIEPRSKADQEKLRVALQEMASKDPMFHASMDQESGQTTLKGMSELHLDRMVDTLQRKYEVNANLGPPQVAYRETLGKRTEIDYTHKHFGPMQFARVRLLFEPTEPGSGYSFESRVIDDAVPASFIAGVESGLMSAMQSGLVAGFPVIDFKATLVGGGYHDIDSSVLAFETAARAAFGQLRDRGDPRLLEPIMQVVVETPEDSIGYVIGDLNSRRATITGSDQRGDRQVVGALVPLANMFGYVGALRSMSEGFATVKMQFAHYREVPPRPSPPDDSFPGAMAMRA